VDAWAQLKVPPPDDGGLTMRSRMTQFTIRMVVVLGIAVAGIVAVGNVVAYSAVERAWAMTQETLAKPFRSPAPKSEFRLSEHQKLRKMFLGQSTPVY
jgi:uncharacterized membrane protein